MRNWFKQLFGLSRLEERVRALENLVAMQPVARDMTAAQSWRTERDKHPAGSPKHIAFTNRLKSLGME